MKTTNKTTKNTSPRNPPLAVTLDTLNLQLPGMDVSIRPLTQIAALQRICFSIVMNANTPIDAIAGLIRAWDVLEERKRILRGVPLPGQLRPDLDPMQLMKAVKRARGRKPLDLIPGGGFAAPADVLEEQPTAPPTESPAGPKTPDAQEPAQAIPPAEQPPDAQPDPDAP